MRKKLNATNLSWLNCAMRASEMERGTRIELATNSVEGCDSTIELPPPFLHSIVGN